MRTREAILSFVVSRPVGAVAGVLLALVFVGCMSFSADRVQVISDDPPDPADGAHAYPPGDGILEQEGTVTLAGDAVQDVYYPVPYVSPPNLTITPPTDCLVSQRASHFRIRFKGSTQTCLWKAKGVKALLAGPPPDPPPVLPAEPVPVSAKP